MVIWAPHNKFNIGHYPLNGLNQQTSIFLSTLFNRHGQWNVHCVHGKIGQSVQLLFYRRHGMSLYTKYPLYAMVND